MREKLALKKSIINKIGCFIVQSVGFVNYYNKYFKCFGCSFNRWLYIINFSLSVKRCRTLFWL